MIVTRGDIYFAYVQAPEAHRVVVVSRDELNAGDYCVVVPFTSRKVERRRHLQNYVSFPASYAGLDKDCLVAAADITVVHRGDLDFNTGILGRVDSERMREIVQAIGYVMEAVCEPE